MSKHLAVGDKAPPIDSDTITGCRVHVPDASGKLVHLQFRRFAGCSICNLHMQSFIKRNVEIVDAGVKELLIYHSTTAELTGFQANYPFDVVADPSKSLYHRYGVGTSIMAILSPSVLSVMVQAVSLKEKPEPKMPENGGILGLPADFLIEPGGKIVACHYGTSGYDQWSVDELLNLAKR